MGALAAAARPGLARAAAQPPIACPHSRSSAASTRRSSPTGRTSISRCASRGRLAVRPRARGARPAQARADARRRVTCGPPAGGFGRGYVLAKYRVGGRNPLRRAKIAALDWPVLAVHLVLRREAGPARERLRARSLGLRVPGRRAPLELATIGFVCGAAAAGRPTAPAVRRWCPRLTSPTAQAAEIDVRLGPRLGDRDGEPIRLVDPLDVIGMCVQPGDQLVGRRSGTRSSTGLHSGKARGGCAPVRKPSMPRRAASSALDMELEVTEGPAGNGLGRRGSMTTSTGSKSLVEFVKAALIRPDEEQGTAPPSRRVPWE